MLSGTQTRAASTGLASAGLRKAVWEASHTPALAAGLDFSLRRSSSLAKGLVPAAPARPLPGFSPASAEEVAEESVRTLGSL